ncbi:MAG: TadE/TadG family type IV pilus assembly protein [Terriglobales bacterium]
MIEAKDLNLLNIKLVAHQLANTDGAEIAEAAVVLPLVFMLLLGIIWFGRAYNIYSTIQQAAQQGAITAARNSCATCLNATAPDGTISSCPVTGSAGSVAYAIATVMCASSIDPTQIPASSNPPTPISCVNPPALVTCTTPGNITVCRQALLNSPGSATQPSQCGVIVSLQYPFQFYLPFTSLNMQTITLYAQAQSRMEN